MKGDNVIVVLSPFHFYCLVTLLSHSCEEKYFKNCVRSKVLTPFGSFTFRIPLNWLMVSIPLRSIHKLRKRMYSSMMVAEF